MANMGAPTIATRFLILQPLQRRALFLQRNITDGTPTTDSAA